MQRILGGQRGSAIGRRYRFEELRDAAQFRARLPVMEPEKLAAESEALLAGDSSCLVQEPVLLLEPTSGSTSGSRLIPYTASLKAEFQRGIGAWIGQLFWEYPQLLGGCSYWCVTPPHPRTEQGAVPVGFEHDSEYLGGWASYLFAQVSALAPGLPQKEDFWFETARQLLDCRRLRFVSVWSPTFWLTLVEFIRANWKGLSPPGSPSEPGSWWPQLRVLSCWNHAMAAPGANRLAAMFPNVRIQGKGLVATEGLVTIPWGGSHPLALGSHFFEFLDESGSSYLADELVLNGEYQVLLTTGGGLYRYRLGDRVRVDGWVGECPSLRFLGRENVLDHAGEKLSEAFVASVLEQEFEGFAMLAYEDGGYSLFADELGPEKLELVERELVKNFHYQLCRQLGQLQPLKGFNTRHGWSCYQQACADQQRLGDIKPVALHSGQDWSQRLQGSWLQF